MDKRSVPGTGQKYEHSQKFSYPLYRRSRYTCMIRKEDVPDHSISQFMDTGELVVAYTADETTEMLMTALDGGGTTPQLVLNYMRYGSTTIHLADIEYGVELC